jgi:drug/metabolite transporter (DMT)-like permease
MVPCRPRFNRPAVAASALTLGEPLTATLAASLGLILGGLALVNLADRRGR